MKKTVLLTGAAGFIGFHLAKRLLQQDLYVIGYDNMNDYYDVNLKQSRLEIISNLSDKFTFIKDDLTNMDSLKDVFEKYRPNIVVNLAAQAGVRYSIDNPRAYIESNLVGFFNILECCREYMVEHLLYASSSSVYGNQEKTPFSVDDKTDQPVSLYAATKKSNELMAYAYSHLYGIPATGLRFFTVYGPFGRPDMAYFKFAEKIMNGEVIQIFNNGDLYRDFTYIDDVVECLCCILNSSPKNNADGVRHKVYNIGNNQPEKLLDFIEILEECLGKKAKKEYLPMQPGDVFRTYADVEGIYRDFGFRPDTGIKEGIGKFAEWYRWYINLEEL